MPGMRKLTSFDALRSCCSVSRHWQLCGWLLRRLLQPPGRRTTAGLQTVYFDVKHVTQGAAYYNRRSTERRAPLNSRAQAVPAAYQRHARELDTRFSRRPDGGRYPSPSEQTARGMVGPVLAELRGGRAASAHERQRLSLL